MSVLVLNQFLNLIIIFMCVLKITRSKPLRYQLNGIMTVFMHTKLGKGRSINRIYISLSVLTKISLSEERNQTNIVYICD